MPHVDSLIDSISQHINDSNQGDNVFFSTIDLKYAYRQLNLLRDTSCHCNFNIICGDLTGSYRFKTVLRSYGYAGRVSKCYGLHIVSFD